MARDVVSAMEYRKPKSSKKIERIEVRVLDDGSLVYCSYGSDYMAKKELSFDSIEEMYKRMQKDLS